MAIHLFADWKYRPGEPRLQEEIASTREVLAAWKARGLLKTLITQNIDNRHREEGIQWSRIRLRLHGCQNSLQSVLNNKGETE
jgi:NAD-dependent SIR2 family protein deacetylase